MSAVFKDAKLKIERAHKHIDDLNSAIVAFQASDLYSIRPHNDPELWSEMGSDYVLTLDLSNRHTEHWPLIIGDGIHNIRSALDLMTYETVKRCTKKTPSNWARFPFGETLEKLKAAIKGGEIEACGPDVVKLIVDVVKPYEKGGDAALYGLHRLDIVDKHHLLIPMVTLASTDIVAVAGKNVHYQIASWSAKAGEKHEVPLFVGDKRLHPNNKPSLEVTFGEIFKGQPIIPTLHQLAQLVAGIVQKFEKYV